MTAIERLNRWTDEHRGVFFDLIRIYLGIGLAIKALYFLQHPEYLESAVEQIGMHWVLPAAAAHFVIFAHLGGGILLALGLFTRVATALQVPVLVGAVFYAYLPGEVSVVPRQSFEFSALVLFLLLLVLVRGGGPISVDRYLMRNPWGGGEAPTIG